MAKNKATTEPTGTPVNVSTPVFTLSVKANERTVSKETIKKAIEARMANIKHAIELTKTGAFKVTTKFFEENNLKEYGLNYSSFEGKVILVITDEERSVSMKGTKGEKKALTFNSTELMRQLVENNLADDTPVEYEVVRGAEKGTTKQGIKPVKYEAIPFVMPMEIEGCITFYELSPLEESETENTEENTEDEVEESNED